MFFTILRVALAADAVSWLVRGSTLPFGHPSASMTYPAREGFTLWLVEEFEQPLDLDADPIWTWSDGGLSEGQVRFVREAIKFEDGRMVLEANNQAPTERSCSHAEVGFVDPKTLTSGELRTRHNMFRYGFYEVRMKAPTVQPNNAQINGNYVATMFAYRDAKFKHWREIDIEVTGDDVNSVTMNVLNAENTSRWSPWIQATQQYHADGVNVREEFNTFAFEWLPSGITWYFNGQEVGRHAADSSLPIPEMSTKIMMNLWIFGPSYAFGGEDGSSNEYPMRSEYDWFRFYKWDADSSYPCADMGTDCLTEDDWYLSGNNPCDGISQSLSRYVGRTLVADEGGSVGELSSTTLEACKQGCSANSQCRSFAFSLSLERCYLKDKVVSAANPDNPMAFLDFRTYYREDLGDAFGTPPCLATCEPAATTEQLPVLAGHPKPFGHPSPTMDYPAREGFTLWLVEEFEQPLDLDADPIWTWSDGGLGEGQVRFVKDNIKFQNGRMILEARDGLPTAESCSHAEVRVVGPKNLTSAELRTRHNMFRYGYYEVHMKAPSVQPQDAQINGNFVATMFAYRDAKFKHWREVDIEVTGDGVNTVTMNVLNAENTSAWSPQIQAAQRYRGDALNVRKEFNTYAFEWLPSGVTWYLNGQVVGHHGANSSLPVPDLSTKIMMNLWIFGSSYGFGGEEGSNNVYPMRTEYEWFRFYRWDGDSSYPCSDMTTECLTEDDQYLSANNPCDGIPQVGDVYGVPPCSALCAAEGEQEVGGDSANYQDFFYP